MRRIEYIIVHCSDSRWGDASVIDEWHRELKFDRIGYHKVILNGRRRYSSKYDIRVDGEIEDGRPDYMVGAHCKGSNYNSLGVCLIGKMDDENFPSENQFYSLLLVCKQWQEKYGIPTKNILGHREMQIKLKYERLKNCPGFNMALVRDMLTKGVDSDMVREEQRRFNAIRKLALAILQNC